VLGRTLRPKLKGDTFYLPVADGVYFRNNQGSLKIKGKNTYRWIESLAPYLDGTRTLVELTHGLDAEKQAMVTQLVENLLTHHFLKDVSHDQPHTLSPTELETYASEIAFIDSFQNSAAARFEYFRGKHILVIGSGLTLTALVHATLKGGVCHLGVVITDECDTARQRHRDYLELFQQRDPQQLLQELVTPDWKDDAQVLAAIQPFDLILHISDRPMLTRAQRLNRLCFNQQKPLIQAMLVEDEAWIGPLVLPATHGCWECAWRRLQANQDRHSNHFPSYTFEDQREAPISRFTALTTAALVANEMSFEIFKHVTEAGPLETLQHLVVVDLETLHRQKHAFLPHPLCQTCQHPVAPTEASFLQTITELEQAEPLDSALFSRRAASCIERRLGLLRTLDEEDFEQIPLNVCRATVSNPMSLENANTVFEVTGTGPGFAVTRRRTTQQALELYAANLLDQRRLPAFEKGSCSPLMLTMDRFSGEDTTSAETGWTWAFALTRRQAHLVPANLVFPMLGGRTPLVQVIHGIASGMSWAEAVSRALLTTCQILTIAHLHDAITPFPQIDLATVALDPQGARQRYVLDIMREAVTVYDVTGPLQVPTFAICFSERTIVYSTHLDVTEALKEGLELAMRYRLAQAFRTHQPTMTGPAVPELPAALRGDIALLSQHVAPQQWFARQQWLQLKLQDHGWQSFAVPLDHDPACNQILPFIVRVLLARVSSDDR
jgi:putative thiazole-containing bacteriocin maturation protein